MAGQLKHLSVSSKQQVQRQIKITLMQASAAELGMQLNVTQPEVHFQQPLSVPSSSLAQLNAEGEFHQAYGVCSN